MQNEHDQIMLLLPWHVNGTLEPEESGQVERHLSSCLVCRKELERLQMAATAVRQSDPFTTTAETSFTKISAQLEADKKADGFTQILRKHWQTLTDWAPYQLLWALPSLVLAVLIIQLHTPHDLNNYRTLTTQQIKSGQPEKNALYIKVVFDSQITLDSFQQILDGMSAKIINGPTAVGAYTLQIPVFHSANQNRLLNTLQNNEQVVFAERASAY